ncbi:hypothetical protein PMZ80_001288 [Knufia obscura]|uniref:F-box domain-containing protein n=1 Tax=Knufia obscura TaxID=1635080 RepID=A0ABR0S2S0_9EURO|nr:hypothetical protein PMZ80_001288 [Knufia obscura]
MQTTSPQVLSGLKLPATTDIRGSVNIIETHKMARDRPLKRKRGVSEDPTLTDSQTLLSFQSSRCSVSAPPRIPQEILDLVIEHCITSDGGPVQNLDVSLVSKAWQQTVNSIRWKDVSIRTVHAFHTVTHAVLCQSKKASRVRSLNIQVDQWDESYLRHSFWVKWPHLTNFSSLHYISVNFMDDSLCNLSTLLLQLPKSLHSLELMVDNGFFRIGLGLHRLIVRACRTLRHLRLLIPHYSVGTCLDGDWLDNAWYQDDGKPPAIEQLNIMVQGHSEWRDRSRYLASMVDLSMWKLCSLIRQGTFPNLVKGHVSYYNSRLALKESTIRRISPKVADNLDAAVVFDLISGTRYQYPLLRLSDKNTYWSQFYVTAARLNEEDFDTVMPRDQSHVFHNDPKLRLVHYFGSIREVMRKMEGVGWVDTTRGTRLPRTEFGKFNSRGLEQIAVIPLSEDFGDKLAQRFWFWEYDAKKNLTEKYYLRPQFWDAAGWMTRSLS